MAIPFIGRFIRACIIGFMIAWHYVYYQDDRLKEDTQIHVIIEERDQ